jgi:RNA polymerase sigma-70 factor (ECF subfamily)
MGKGSFGDLLWHACKACIAAEARDLSDGELLHRFLAHREETAFSLLVQRHGRMVLGVCLRVLGDEHNAEDAFQATFLVLAQRAGSIKRKGSVGAWLHTVARGIALRAKRRMAAQRQRERQAAAGARLGPLDEMAGRELRSTLDEEIARLPEKYRAPIVLCYLEGKSYERAAQELGWPNSTLARRLERGRELMRQQLVRRGIAVSVGALTTTLTEKALATAVGALLTIHTGKAATSLAAGKAAAVGSVSAGAMALAEEPMKASLGFKVKVALLVLTLGLAVGGAGLAGHGTWQEMTMAATLRQSPSPMVNQGGPVKINAPAPAAPPLPAQEPAVPAHYLIYPVTTALERELMPAGADLFVVVDTTDALQDGRIVAEGLHLEELRKDLVPLKKAETRLHITFDLRNSFPTLLGKPTDDLLRYAFIGFGRELGFAEVKATGNYYNVKTTWVEQNGKRVSPKAGTPQVDEPVMGDDAVKIYPVRTELSRYLTSDADCVVVFVAPIQKGSPVVSDKIRETTTKAIAELKLGKERKIFFAAQRGAGIFGEELNRVLDEFRQFSVQLGFGTSSITRI